MMGAERHVLFIGERWGRILTLVIVVTLLMWLVPRHSWKRHPLA
jgi:hypothetical protein